MSTLANDQCLAFASEIENSEGFARWVLDTVGYRGIKAVPILARGDYPWSTSEVSGKQSMTDILLVFEKTVTGERFALHLKNGKDGISLTIDQAKRYKTRAEEWIGTQKFLDYTSFRCVVIATATFLGKHVEESQYFDAIIRAEEVAEFIPIFGK